MNMQPLTDGAAVVIIIVPFLIAGGAISFVDCRTRLIPRALVVASAAAELSALAIVSYLLSAGWQRLPITFFTALAITVVHAGLSLLIPTAIGLGDAWVMGLSALPVCYICGLPGILVWLLILCFSGGSALITAALWHRSWGASLAFAPFITGSAVISIGLALAIHPFPP